MASEILYPSNHWISTKPSELPAGLEVVLLRGRYAFPWSRFLYAVGDRTTVDLYFSTHTVSICGFGLDPLLTDLAAQRVAAIYEAARADKFGQRDSCIESITVEKLEND